MVKLLKKELTRLHDRVFQNRLRSRFGSDRVSICNADMGEINYYLEHINNEYSDIVETKNTFPIITTHTNSSSILRLF